MTTGQAIHIGLNHVDPAGYGGWSGQLAGCLNDAHSMQAITTGLGYGVQLLLDEQATAANVVGALQSAASTLQSGDILVLTYSGHGGQVPDTSGDETDSQDETWVLFDRMLLDDEIYDALSKFKAGVRVFTLSDSCHSGTVLRDVVYAEAPAIRQARDRDLPLAFVTGQQPVRDAALTRQALDLRDGSPSARAATAVMDAPTTSVTTIVKPTVYRVIPPEVLRNTLIEHAVMYSQLRRSVPRTARAAVTCSAVLISGCQDNQTSQDGTTNGLFTEKLLEVWAQGGFTGDYPTFHHQILAKMPPEQSPNYFTVGTADPAFEAQKPFTLDGVSGNGSSTTTTTTTTTTAPGTTSPGGTPTVRGPATCARTDQAPSFQIGTTASASFFEFEIASSQDLLDAQSGQSEDSYFATWSTSSTHLTGSSYSLDAAAWDRLKANDRLWYRIHVASGSTGWDGYATSSDSASAPSITITGDPSSGQDTSGQDTSGQDTSGQDTSGQDTGGGFDSSGQDTSGQDTGGGSDDGGGSFDS